MENGYSKSLYNKIQALVKVLARLLYPPKVEGIENLPYFLPVVNNKALLGLIFILGQHVKAQIESLFEELGQPLGKIGACGYYSYFRFVPCSDEHYKPYARLCSALQKGKTLPEREKC